MALAPPKEQPVPQPTAQSSEAKDLRQCLNCKATGRSATALLGQDGITVELLLTCRSSNLQLLFTAPIRLPLVSLINGILCTRHPGLAPRGWAVPPLQRLRRLSQHPPQESGSAHHPDRALSPRLGSPRPALHHHLAQANLGQVQQQMVPLTHPPLQGVSGGFQWCKPIGQILAALWQIRAKATLCYLHSLAAVIGQV